MAIPACSKTISVCSNQADDGVACQVDQHCHGEDETRHLLIQPVLVNQALEGDQVGGDGGGGAEVDQQSLRHVDVKAERVGAGQHEERCTPGDPFLSSLSSMVNFTTNTG